MLKLISMYSEESYDIKNISGWCCAQSRIQHQPLVYFLLPKCQIVNTRCDEYGAHVFDLDAVATGSVDGMILYIRGTDKDNLEQNHYTHH